MMLTLVIAGALFVAMLGMLALGFQQVEQERSARAAAVFANAPRAQPGRCMLCNAPLRRPTTVDEVVFEVEHRIDAELADIAAVLSSRPAARDFERLYQA